MIPGTGVVRLSRCIQFAELGEAYRSGYEIWWIRMWLVEAWMERGPRVKVQHAPNASFFPFITQGCVV